MTVIQSNLFYVIKRFRDSGDSIKTLYRTNESFKTICDDYRQCAEAVDHWNDSM
jgi:hypothetical protein